MQIERILVSEKHGAVKQSRNWDRPNLGLAKAEISSVHQVPTGANLNSFNATWNFFDYSQSERQAPQSICNRLWCFSQATSGCGSCAPLMATGK
jgi:hypothetical protein